MAEKPAKVRAPCCRPPPGSFKRFARRAAPRGLALAGESGTQGRVLTATHFQAPALTRAPSSRSPAAPQSRAAPPLPCAALPCWAARAWTSRTSRQNPGTRPEPMAWSSARRGRGGVAAPERARGRGGGDWRAPRGGSGLGVRSARWGARPGAGRRPEGRPGLSHPTPSFACGELEPESERGAGAGAGT